MKVQSLTDKNRASSYSLETSSKMRPHLFKFSLLILILVSVSFSSVSATTVKPYTTYDGVTWEKYVTYLDLDGTQSVELPLDSLKIGQQQDYTVMLWIKPKGDSWGTRFQYAFEFTSSLQCFFTSANTLMCESMQNCDKLQADISTIGPNQWTHITVTGTPTVGSFLQIESNAQVLASDSRSYITLQQVDSTWKVCLGGCEAMYGFLGGMREFIFINQYVTLQTALRIKNHYLLWDSTVIAYYRFAEKDFLKNEFKNAYATIDYTSNSTKSLQSRDYIPNDICFPITDTRLFYNFSQSIQDISTISIDNRWSPSATKWEYSFSVWVKIGTNSCTNSNPSDAKNNCFLVYLNEAFMLYQPQKNQVAVFFFNSRAYYESQSNILTVPDNQWVNIQFAADINNGYDFRIYDILGRLMSQTSVVKDLYEENVDTKQLYLFKGYQGLAKSLIMYSQRKHLPLTTPSVNLTRGQVYSNDDCIAYFMFTDDSISVKSSTSSNLVNYCKNSQYGFLNATISYIPTYVGSYYADYAYSSGATVGLVTTNQQLFDGIACNDGSTVNQLQNTGSYIKTVTQKFTSNFSAATVEFWFKPTQYVNQTNYLFSLWGQNRSKEYMSIYYDKTQQALICTPFLNDSSSTSIAYSNYTDSNRGWFHITCAYSQSSLLTGYLFKTPFTQTTEISLANISATILNDTYSVFIGNNRLLTRGTPSLLVREVRVWGYKRSIDDIAGNRYRQIDPRSYTQTQLVTYLRLSEGGYSEYNMASILATNATYNVTFSNMSYAASTDLTICPINTYYSQDFSKCYQDPITQLVATVYPLKDNEDNSNFYWVFDSNSTQLINPTFSSQIQPQWQFNDTLLKAISTSQSSQSIMKLPISAFREDSQYKVRLNYSNTDITFNEYLDFTFVPTCQYYVVNGYTAHSFYYNYTNPTNTEDIKFSLNMLQTSPQCSSYYFYNQLVQKVNYQFVPALNQSVNLNITYNADGSISVVIPKSEQYKIPVRTDQKIIFSLYWTNSQYSSYISTTDLTFQNVIFTINFAIPGSMVIPSLTASQSYVLKDQNVTFDASGTYISNVNDTNKQNNLTFSWVCPSGLESLCANQTGEQLLITSKGFDNASGTYNKTYTFTVNIQWTRMINSTTTYENYSASISNIWYNAPVPTFTIYTPATVKSTVDAQKFTVTVNNYDVVYLPQLNITWSIVPNLTIAALNLTSNNTVLTVAAGGFLPLTNYTMAVTITHKIFPQATSSQSVSFVTQTPPYGGNVTISPTVGYVLETNFTIKLASWKSQNPPVTYRVYSTSTPGGTTTLSQLSSWQQDNTTFTFKAPNTNPYLIQITDLNGEYTWYKVTPTVTMRTSSTGSSTKNFLTNIKVLNLISDKFSYMTSVIGALTATAPSTASVTTQASSSDPTIVSTVSTSNSTSDQVTTREAVIDQITANIQLINDEKNIESGDSQQIASDSVQMINDMTQYTLYLNDYIVNSSVAILQQVQNCTSVYSSLIQEEDTFSSNFANALSNLFQYSQQQLQYASSSSRLLYNTSTVDGIVSMIDDLKQMKSNYVSELCSQTNKDSLAQDIVTDSFNIVLEKFSTKAQVEIRSFLNQDDDVTRINLDEIDMMTALEQIDQNIDSACVQTTFYKTKMLPENQQKITQYSSTLLEFSIDEYPQYNPRSVVSMYFAINPTTFKTNQSVCMAYQNTNQQWAEDACTTQIDEDNLQVKCQCSMIDSMYYGIFTDPNRKQGEDIKQVATSGITTTQSTTTSTSTIDPSQLTVISGQIYQGTPTQSVSFIAIILIIVIMGTVVPSIAYVLDKRDHKLATSQDIGQDQLDKLKKIAKLSNQPFAYWKSKIEDVQNYSIQSRSLFSNILSVTHPFLSIFTKYDILIDRLTRFSVYFLQVSIFALICVLIFGPSYRESDPHRIEQVIDSTDINALLIAGIAGMFLLLPLPLTKLKSTFTNTCPIKTLNNATLNEKSSFDQQQTNNQLKISNGVVHIDNLPNDFIEPSPIKPNSDNRSQLNTFESAHELDFQDETSNSGEFKIVEKNKPLKWIIAAFAYVLSVAAIALTIIYSIQVPPSNQYCMVASFYIGFFGSLFMTNFLRVILNSVLVDKIVNQKTHKWAKFIVSSDAIRVAQEIQFVRQAEIKIQKKKDLKFPSFNEKSESHRAAPHQESQDNSMFISQDCVLRPEIDEKLFHGSIKKQHLDDVVISTKLSPQAINQKNFTQFIDNKASHQLSFDKCKTSGDKSDLQ